MPPPDTPLIESLARAVARHGRDWCGDMRRCEAMLKDLIPDRPREIKLLVDAVEAGVVRDLTGSQVSLPAAVLIERGIRRLHDAMGLREDLARWTVGVWAVVLGITDTMPEGPPEDPVRKKQSTNGGVTPVTTKKPWPLVAAGFAVVVVGTAYFMLGGGGDTKPPAPRVTALAVETTRGAEPVCRAGDDLVVVATFSRPVRVTGRPRIEFTVAGDSTRREAVFVRGDGTDRLSFLFEVPTGSIDGTGITLATPQSIDTADGTIADASTGTAADLALEPPAGFAAVRIDGVSPRVVSVEPPQGTADRRKGDRLEFLVTFDEPVTVEGRAAVEFDDGEVTRSAEFAGMADPRTLRFTSMVTGDYTVRHGVVMKSLLLGSGLDSGSIHDAAGNPANVEFAAAKSVPFTINPEPPSVPPAGKEPGEVEKNSIGMKLVTIPAGEFEMGSNEYDDEKPVHRVRITKPFWLGQTEVTQGQFERVMGATPWRGKTFVKDGPTVAASYVSWDDAAEFCRKLTEIERRAGRLPAGGAYRLPTEAEWEYACRAGRKTKWSFGDEEARLSEYAWWGGIVGDGNAKTEKYAHEVGRKKANPWGLFDMHGNVYEWCSDWADAEYYAQSPAVDPKGPASAGSFRVLRGGGWFFNPVYCRSANRNLGPPSYGDFIIGFRVVLSVE